MKKFEKILGVLLCSILFLGMALGSGNSSQSDYNVDVESTGEPVTTETQTDWLSYYSDNGIEVIAVDANVLYEYGAYYTNQTVCTAITVESKESNSLKANTDNNDSFFFSIVASFADESEISSISSEDVVVVSGVVEEPLSIGSSITLNECHVISVGEEAESTLQEYASQRSSHTEYAISLQEASESAVAQQAVEDRETYVSNCQEVDYSDVERNPDNYNGTYITFSGDVIQVAEGWLDSVTLRVQSGDDIWYVTYFRAEGESRILEGDNITVYGECSGVTTYTSVIGDSVTIPSVNAEFIDIN